MGLNYERISPLASAEATGHFVGNWTSGLQQSRSARILVRECRRPVYWMASKGLAGNWLISSHANTQWHLLDSAPKWAGGGPLGGLLQQTRLRKLTAQYPQISVTSERPRTRSHHGGPVELRQSNLRLRHYTRLGSVWSALVERLARSDRKWA